MAIPVSTVVLHEEEGNACDSIIWENSKRGAKMLVL
jgi:hypothetical protein